MLASKLVATRNFITSKAGRQLLKAQSMSPGLLFGVGVVGVVGATVLACKATLDLEETLNHSEKHQMDVDVEHVVGTKAHKRASASVKLHLCSDIGKLYAPAITVGIISVTALTSSHVILTRRNATLMAAYTTLDQAFKEYRERVVSEIGEEKEKEIRDALRAKHADEAQTEAEFKPSGLMYAQWFDMTCAPWQPQEEYNLMFLRSQQNYANEKLKARGHVFLNEIYDALNLPRTPGGAIVGWVKDSETGDNYIDFGVFEVERGDARVSSCMERDENGGILINPNVDGIIYKNI